MSDVAPRELILPRSTNALIVATILDEGEIRYNLDTLTFHVGDGSTLGGKAYPNLQDALDAITAINEQAQEALAEVQDLAAQAAASAASITEDLPDTDAQFANQFTQGEVDTTSALRTVSGGGAVVSSTTTGGRPCWAFTAAAGGETGFYMGKFQRALMAAHDHVSLGIQVFSVDPSTTSGSPRIARMLLRQFKADNTHPVADQQVNITVALEGINAAVWKRLTNIAIDATTTYYEIYIGINTAGESGNRVLKFGDMYLRPGNWQRYARPPGLISGKGPTIYFNHATGTPSGSGSFGSPLLSADQALTLLSGTNGTIHETSGAKLPGVQNPLDMTLVQGRVRLVGASQSAPNYDQCSSVMLAPYITGWVQDGTYTNVWSTVINALVDVAYTGSSPAGQINWGYFDGVADPRSSMQIPLADRIACPELVGMTNYMYWATRVMATTASTVSTAKAEINAAGAGDPRLFVDMSAGSTWTIYCYGDPSTGPVNFYFDTAVPFAGHLNFGGYGKYGELIIENFEIQGGQYNSSPFSLLKLDRARAKGAAENTAIALGTLIEHDWFMGWCSGSLRSTVGDIIGGHNGARLRGNKPTGILGHDDFISSHEGSIDDCDGGLGILNGGTCVAPAIGCKGTYKNIRSRHNQQVDGRKRAAFMVVNGGHDGTTGDSRDFGSARFERCSSFDDVRGFYASGLAGSGISAYGTVDQCTVRNLRAAGAVDIATNGAGQYGYAGSGLTYTEHTSLFSSSIGSKDDGTVTNNAM